MRGRLRVWLGWSFLVVWVPVTLLLTGALMVNHVIALPEPGDVEALSAAVASLRTEGREAPLVVHIVADGCSCTDSLFQHLLDRGPRAGLDEIVLFVGDDPQRERAVLARGYRLAVTDRDALWTDFGLEAAPILVVLEPSDALTYVGGYYRFPAAVRPLDEQVLASREAGLAHDALPIFGCAVSERLAEQIDPLGLQR